MPLQSEIRTRKARRAGVRGGQERQGDRRRVRGRVRGRLALLAALALSCAGGWGAVEGWSPDPAVNTPVCTATSEQLSPRIVSDGLGGTIIAWLDWRNGNQDIYAQRFNGDGAAQWAANGVALCTAAGGQNTLSLVSDGAGGAIASWVDSRGASDDIYAQRIDASGAVQWGANGVAVCTASNAQDASRITSDGSGGAVVVWRDRRSGADLNLYAQRVNASGQMQWTADGVEVCMDPSTQNPPEIASDGTGGVIVAWEDYRNGNGTDMYAQRINGSGVAQWTANGVALCTAASWQERPQVVPDGSGGAIVSWSDQRSGAQVLYAQRVNASGAVQWTANGVSLCTIYEDQYEPKLVADGSGGALAAWYHYMVADDLPVIRSLDIYAQRVNGAGVPVWGPEGVQVCAAHNDQGEPAIAPDGSGGAVVIWNDYRSGSASNIYAQRLNASGTPQWTANGVVVSSAAGQQLAAQIAADSQGGFVGTWVDKRAGSAGDIYAARLYDSGALVPVSLSGFALE